MPRAISFHRIESLIKHKHLLMYASTLGSDAWVMDNLVKIKQRAFQIQHVRFLCWLSEYVLFAVLFSFFLVISSFMCSPFSPFSSLCIEYYLLCTICQNVTVLHI